MSDDKHQLLYTVKTKAKIICPKCNQVVTEKVTTDNNPLFVYLCVDCVRGVTDKYFGDLII
jgi:uncharacterized radical SAM superfamily Fe-S cluster-containing enzyme